MLYHLYEQEQGTAHGFELSMGGATSPGALYASQQALDKQGTMSVIVRLPDDAQAPLELDYDGLYQQAIIATEVWPGRGTGDVCIKCHQGIEYGVAVRYNGAGDFSHADASGCQEGRDEANGRYWIVTVPEETGAEGFDTHTVELLPYATKRGSRYRRVWISAANETWQTQRYASCAGLCVLDTPQERADLEDLAVNGLADRVKEEEAI